MCDGHIELPKEKIQATVMNIYSDMGKYMHTYMEKTLSHTYTYIYIYTIHMSHPRYPSDRNLLSG